MLNFAVLDAAPSPAILFYMVLGIGGFFVVIGLITLSVIFIVKAIKKKKKNDKQGE